MKSTHLAAPLLAAAALFTALPTAAAEPLSEFTADEQTLLEEISRAYDPADCSPISTIKNLDIAAGIECENDVAGSPATTTYYRFETESGMNAGFDLVLDGATFKLTCIGKTENPTSWSYNRTPEAVSGQVACATRGETSAVVWSKTSTLLLAIAVGADMDEVVGWWKKNGG